VVRDFQHIRSQVGARRQQRALRLQLGVAGQQDAHAIHRREEHFGGIVRVATGAVKRARRPQHVESYVADVKGRAGRRR
jgi:hypothetical protein